MQYPGERENRIYQERSLHGIPLNDKVLTDLQNLSAEFYLPLNDI